MALYQRPTFDHSNMFFKDIIGQEEASSHLAQAVNDGRIANTQLFLGQPGYGTLPLALAYARYVLCTQRANNDSCGTCPSCTMLNDLAHPDLHFSFPIFLAQKVRNSDEHVKDWRKAVLNNPYLDGTDWYAALGKADKKGIMAVDESMLIMKRLQLRSFSGGYRIFLIWLPEAMNVQAANKLLKVFEEPTEKTVFIMVANEVEQLLPTVVSRTQIFKVPKLNMDAISAWLHRVDGLEEDERRSIAARAGGDMNKALKEAKDQNGQLLDRFREWMRVCFKKDVLGAMDFVDDLVKSDKEYQKSLLKYGMHLSRQCVVHEHHVDSLVLAANPERVFIEKLTPYLSTDKAFVIQKEFNEAITHIERNANTKILFTDLTFTLFKVIGK